MIRPPDDIGPYLELLRKWMPTAQLGPDAVLVYEPHKTRIVYDLQIVPHLRHQDARVVAERLRQRIPVGGLTRPMVLAPHVRREQGETLERAKVDYVDLAGNAHIEGPGFLVHVEGRRLREVPRAKPGRQHTAWIKTVMALLIEPQLIDEPFRALAARADVALGTVAGCMADLQDRGLLLRTNARRRIIDRQALVALWVQAYTETLRPKLRERRFQIRADDKAQVLRRLDTCLKDAKVPWALTGADAAERQTHYFRVAETEIYAKLTAFDDRDLLKQLMAQPAVTAGNLVVIEAPGPLALPDAANDQHMAPPLLIYAELRYRNTQQAQEAADMMLPMVLGHGTD